MGKKKIKITVWSEGMYKTQYRYWEVGATHYIFLGMCETFLDRKTWYPETQPTAKRLLSA